MKKILSIMLIAVMCLCVSSCGFFEFCRLTTEYVVEEAGRIITAIPEAFNEIEEDYKYLDELSAEIVRCLDEKDSEGLKALFCDNAKNNNSEIDLQIQDVFNTYDSKSESFYVTQKSSEGGYRDGVYYDKSFTPHIRITTSEGKEYTVSYILYTVYDDDKGKIGINALGLYDEWPNELAGIG